MAKIAKNLTQLIGRTPLMELAGYSSKHHLEKNIVAKLESFNPGGSVKDQDSIEAANEHKIPMMFTGMRHFLH